MRARDFFKAVLQAENELKVLNAKVRRYEEIGMSLGAAMGSVGRIQNGASKVELAAVGTVDAMRDAVNHQKELIALIAKAERIIRNISQKKYRDILTYRYICGWSFKSISDELAYKDPNSIYRAHGWALVEAQKILNKEEQK